MDGYTDLDVSPNTTKCRLYVYIIILEILLCFVVYCCAQSFACNHFTVLELHKMSKSCMHSVLNYYETIFFLPISCIVFSSLPIDAILVIKLNVCSTRQNVQKKFFFCVFNDVLNVLWMMMNKSIYE